VANLYLNLRRKLDRLLAVTGPLDPAARDRVATRFVEVRVLELLSQRSLGAALAGRAPGPEGSVIKLAWAAAEQALADAAVDVLGLGALDGPWGVGLLSSRSLSIAGGTTEVNKSIVAERVLGLPREPGPR
jgi:alkylation response protein AidB-like acyl-CoA dehydrogenase